MSLNLVTNIDDFNENCLFFCEPMRNNVMNGGNFVRFLYSTHEFTMNGFFVHIFLDESEIERQFTKYRCNFSVAKHKDLINSLRLVETLILNKHNAVQTKKRKNQLGEQFCSGSIKLFEAPTSLENKNFIIKISGIWETESEYGLTFKIMQV